MSETTRDPEALGFTPTFDEAARQAFVGSLKRYINFDVEEALAERFDARIAPSYAKNHGAPPQDRKEAVAATAPDPLFQTWASLNFHSQNLMWDAVQETTDRTIDAKIAAYRQLASERPAGGSLTTSDKLVVRAPVSTTEIHRQPGGYWRERRADDIEQGLNYTGTVELYRAAKGMGAGAPTQKDSLGRFVAASAMELAPDLEISSVLDMGCGTGEQTHAYKSLFPDAQVCAIDCGRPLVRYAHGVAEAKGLAIDFSEQDAAATDFPDESFDFVTSIIMFHETTARQLREILRECHRLLKPGGLALHLDVPYHANRIPLVKQATNDWQVRFNGEPFWTGFVDMDMAKELADAGFDEDRIICEYRSAGPATYFFFGGRK